MGNLNPYRKCAIGIPVHPSATSSYNNCPTDDNFISYPAGSPIASTKSPSKRPSNKHAGSKVVPPQRLQHLAGEGRHFLPHDCRFLRRIQLKDRRISTFPTRLTTRRLFKEGGLLFSLFLKSVYIFSSTNKSENISQTGLFIESNSNFNRHKR